MRAAIRKGWTRAALEEPHAGATRQRVTNFIRVSAGTPWPERIAEGLRTLGKVAARE